MEPVNGYKSPSRPLHAVRLCPHSHSLGFGHQSRMSGCVLLSTCPDFLFLRWRLLVYCCSSSNCSAPFFTPFLSLLPISRSGVVSRLTYLLLNLTKKKELVLKKVPGAMQYIWDRWAFKMALLDSGSLWRSLWISHLLDLCQMNTSVTPRTSTAVDEEGRGYTYWYPILTCSWQRFKIFK